MRVTPCNPLVSYNSSLERVCYLTNDTVQSIEMKEKPPWIAPQRLLLSMICLNAYETQSASST